MVDYIDADVLATVADARALEFRYSKVDWRYK